MYDWLGQHPEVFMSPFKEPRYFCPDLTFYFRYALESDYLPLFALAEDESIVGEASVWYLYSEKAPNLIRSYSGPESRILIMLRNPIEMAYSMHRQLAYMGNEPLDDFEAAYHAQARRKNGYDLPERLNPYEGLFYSSYGRFLAGVDQFLDVFGPENVHTILFDDFVQDDQAAFQEVCRFLGIDDSFVPDLSPSNPTTSVRSAWLREFVRDLPTPIKAMTSNLPPPIRTRLQDTVATLNTAEIERDPLPPSLREALAGDFEPDIHALGQTIGRDLTSWLPEASS